MTADLYQLEPTIIWENRVPAPSISWDSQADPYFDITFQNGGCVITFQRDGKIVNHGCSKDKATKDFLNFLAAEYPNWLLGACKERRKP